MSAASSGRPSLPRIGRIDMESGVLRLVVTLLRRMQQQTGMNLEQLSEYVLNNAAAWNFPVLPSEKPELRVAQERQWHQHLATLDTAILSLVGEQDVAEDQVATKLDEILSSSLWERRLRHRTEERQRVYKSLLANSVKRRRSASLSDRGVRGFSLPDGADSHVLQRLCRGRLAVLYLLRPGLAAARHDRDRWLGFDRRPPCRRLRGHGNFRMAPPVRELSAAGPSRPLQPI